jgi:hypothetical protein
MEIMTIVERARAVGMLVSRLSIRQLLLTLSHCLFRFQYFIIFWEVCNMDVFFFLFSLESGMSLSPTTNTHGVFSISTEVQGHLPLPRVKVVAVLRNRYKSVMSTPRQTNRAHGFLMSPQQVRYHLKVEQLCARRPRRGLVLTYKHQTLRLA